MKNLVKLTSEELDIVCGGGDLLDKLIQGAFISPVGSILLVSKYGWAPFLGSVCAFAVEFLTVYGIGKGIKKLFSSSKKQKKSNKSNF